MKKILILVNFPNRKHNKLAGYLQQNFDDIEVFLKKVGDISVEIIDGKVNFFLDNQNLKEFDLIYFRKVGFKNINLVSSLIIFLDNIKKEYIDKGMLLTSTRGDKLTSQIRLALAGLPVIDTLYFIPNTTMRYSP